MRGAIFSRPVRHVQKRRRREEVEPLQLVLLQHGVGFPECSDHSGVHTGQHGVGMGVRDSHHRHAHITRRFRVGVAAL